MVVCKRLLHRMGAYCKKVIAYHYRWNLHPGRHGQRVRRQEGLDKHKKIWIFLLSIPGSSTIISMTGIHNDGCRCFWTRGSCFRHLLWSFAISMSMNGVEHTTTTDSWRYGLRWILLWQRFQCEYSWTVLMYSLNCLFFQRVLVWSRRHLFRFGQI